MKTIPFFIGFIFNTNNHIINYVSKYSYHRYKNYLNYNDIKQEIMSSYYKMNITLPIDSNDEKIKNIFRDIGKFARNEKKYQLQKNLGNYEPFEFLDFKIDYELPKLLNQELKICNYIENNISIYDILIYEKISFQQYKKIKKNIKNKLKLKDNNNIFSAYADLKNE